MDIEYRQISEITPYKLNAKTHDRDQIQNVANSIKRFGWQQPLVIDQDGVVIIGHCRLEAAKQLGLKTVPCVQETDLTGEEIKELRIADNRTNESPWDYEALEEESAGLDFDGFNFDFKSLDDEVDQQIKGPTEYSMDDFSDEKFRCKCPECGFQFNP